MKNKSTFIKLDRNIKNWRWYQNANTFRVFVHCLLSANVSQYEFEGITIKRGEFPTSYDKIANTLNLTNQQVRTAINHLKSTGEITTKIYSKFQVISIVNYGYYQDKSTGKSTPNQQAVNIQLTVNQQQLKNNKEYIKNDKEECPSGVSPVGVSREGCDIYIHKNSGVQYVLRDGKQFDLSGKPLNDAGYPIIDFKLSKHNN